MEVSGAKAIVVGGNGNPTDMESFRSLTPKTFHGQALAIVQAQDESGTVTLKLSSEGLEGAQMEIKME
jgi:beta-galactosidase